MLTYFDYTFYRIYSYYLKKNDDISLVHSIGFLWILQVVIVGSCFGIIDKIFNGYFTASNQIKEKVYVGLGVIYGIALIFDLIRYLRNNYYQSLKEKFDDFSLNKKLYTWMIFIQPIVLLILTITFLVLTKGH
jgi:hypothetical protein